MRCWGGAVVPGETDLGPRRRWRSEVLRLPHVSCAHRGLAGVGVSGPLLPWGGDEVWGAIQSYPRVLPLVWSSFGQVLWEVASTWVGPMPDGQLPQSVLSHSSTWLETSHGHLD